VRLQLAGVRKVTVSCPGARGGGGAHPSAAPPRLKPRWARPLRPVLAPPLAPHHQLPAALIPPAAGVLLQQRDPAELSADGAALLPAAAELLAELARAADVYLITQVADDVGQAAVTGALEAAGLLGGGPGQVPPQRSLFCSTLDGKTAVVRQLEPDLHVDASATTVGALRRFLPQILHVRPAGRPAAPAAPTGSVACAPSLAEFFGQPGGSGGAS